MSWLSDRFPNVAKHISVLRAAWHDQDKAERNAKPRSDHEFLPAALEIMEKPPSPGLRWLLLLLCALFALALGWSLIGRIDVVAVAGGKTIPAGNAKVIQPIEIGTVRVIHVRNGQYVKQGDLLLEFDPTFADADQVQSSQTLQAAQVVAARNKALLGHILGENSDFIAPNGTPEDIAQTERQLIRIAIGEYEAEMASLRQQRAEKAAELAASQAEVRKLRETLPYIDQQLQARADLVAQGYYSRMQLLEYEQQRTEHRRNIDVQSANAARARAGMGNLDAQMARLRQSFGKGAVTDLVEATDKANTASQDLRKSVQRQRFQEVRAPVDGVVQQLAVTTIGGVVQPAQALMVIVPCTTPTNGQAPEPSTCKVALEVEAFVQNKDVGFIAIGQRVAVKLESFNFTDYGMIEGVVEVISRDAIDLAQQPAGSAKDDKGKPAAQGLVYAARISLRCAPADPTRSPLCDKVQPGMSVQAEIKTGKRRIIQFLLSPISQTIDEAGRER
jgi:hemolysin D